jgi:DNA-nicking Smr family endonuclease
MSRRRNLSDEEHALWAGYARSIKPLEPAKTARKRLAGPGQEAHQEADQETRTSPQDAVRQKPSPAAKSPPLAPFDRRLKQRVARGRDAIDARIDLHGMTQRQAHAELLRFLRQAQAANAKVALVVTGKGGGKGGSMGGSMGGGKRASELGESGVLRRQVPMWLALPEFRHFVVGFDEAHPSHGGQGAIYVRMRRAR